MEDVAVAYEVDVVRVQGVLQAEYTEADRLRVSRSQGLSGDQVP